MQIWNKSPYHGLLFAASWRETAIGVVSVSVRRIDDGIDEEHIVFIIYQYVTVHGIEDVVLPIGVIFSMILRMEAKAQELVMDFLFGCEAGIGNKRLYQYGANFAVSVLGKSCHAVGTSVEILVVCLDAFKKRCEVVVCIAEIVELNNLFLVWRQIDFVL